MLERFKVPDADRVYVSVDAMRAATEAIFLAMGLNDGDARRSADVLMFNDLRGVETHGVSNMLRRYVDGYRSGTLVPRPQIQIERETATTATIHAGGGLGLHVAPFAMNLAIEKARVSGIGAVGVHHAGHMGGAGYHAMLALPHDMIGVAMSTSGRPIVVPTFGAEPRLGTNPIAWAAPTATMPPFVFDIGTSQIAANKVRLAQRVGAKIAPGWLAQLDGTPIMEEGDPPDEFHILPLGGTREMGSHKGYGLGAVVDILASTLTGLGAGYLAGVPGFHLLAYRIDAFVDAEQFKRDMDTFLRGLASTPPAPGHDRVLYPGLLEAEEEVRRRAEGIPYHREVITWFAQIGSELGLHFAFA